MRRLVAIWALNGLLAAASLLALLPLLWMVSASFMPAGAASSYPPPWWPAEPTLAHYRHLLGEGGIGRAFLNSLGVACVATAVSTLLNAAAGHAFAKLRFPGRDRARSGRRVVGQLIRVTSRRTIHGDRGRIQG